jgi:hypothetical protein
MSLDDFCRRYRIGRTKTYEEINAGRLKARKAGRRTIIAEDDAEEWLSLLPEFNEGLDEPSPDACAAAEVRRDAAAQSLPSTQESLPRGLTTATDALQSAASACATARGDEISSQRSKLRPPGRLAAPGGHFSPGVKVDEE